MLHTPIPTSLLSLTMGGWTISAFELRISVLLLVIITPSATCLDVEIRSTAVVALNLVIVDEGVSRLDLVLLLVFLSPCVKVSAGLSSVDCLSLFTSVLVGYIGFMAGPAPTQLTTGNALWFVTLRGMPQKVLLITI